MKKNRLILSLIFSLKGDGPSLTIKDNFWLDFFYAQNLELQSGCPYDQNNFLLLTNDLTFKFNPQAQFFAFLDTRIQGVMGAAETTHHYTAQPIKIGLGRTENCFSPCADDFSLWIRQLFFDIQLPNFYNATIKAGILPYSIGSGLVLGNAYKMDRYIPGQMQEKYVRQYRPGIYGTFTFTDQINCEAYYSILKNQSYDFFKRASFSQLPQYSKTQPLFSCSSLNNHLFTFKMNFTNKQGLEISPYVVINSDKAQHVEFNNDATMNLLTPGAILQVKTKNFSFFIEGACNRGHQYVRAIDRNQILKITNIQQTQLFQNTNTVADPSWQSAYVLTSPEDLGNHKANGEIFTDENDRQFKNSYNRFRNAYTNNLKGFMLMGQCSYHPENWLFSDATLLIGYASGDNNPNDSEEKILANRFSSNTTIYCDHNKNYNGFIGINSLLDSKNITSYFLLEARKLQAAPFYTHPYLTPPILTNTIFGGLGLSSSHEREHHNISWNGNLFAYGQPYIINKGFNYTLYDLFQMNADPEGENETLCPSLWTDATRCSNHFLGIELNGKIMYSYKHFLNIYGIAACFIPGTYYSSIGNKYIPLWAQYELAKPDCTGIETIKNKYALYCSNKSSYFLQLGIELLFDINLQK